MMKGRVAEDNAIMGIDNSLAVVEESLSKLANRCCIPLKGFAALVSEGVEG